MIKFTTVNCLPVGERNKIKGADYYDFGGAYDQHNAVDYGCLKINLNNSTLYALRGVEYYKVDNSLYQHAENSFKRKIESRVIRSCDILSKLTDIVGDFEIEEKPNGDLKITTWTCKRLKEYNNIKFEVKTVYTLSRLEA